MAAILDRLVGGFPSSLALALAALPVARAQSTKLNDPLARAVTGEVRDVEISPNGEWAVYRANLDTTELVLFAASTKGGTPVVLANTIPYGGPIEISADSRFVVYYASPDLFLVPIDGSRAPVPIVEDISGSFNLSADGRVLFARPAGIFGVPLEGGDEVLVAPFPAQVSFAGGLVLSTDGRWAVFKGNTSGRLELYSAALDGSTGLIRLNGDLVTAGKVRFYGITPDSRHVVYVADQETAQVNELYSVPIDGSRAFVKLSGPLTRTRSLAEWGISPDSARVVYRADQEQDEVYELYSAPIEGGTPALKLNAPLPVGGDVNQFRIADGRSVVYRADQAQDERSELFSVASAGGSLPRKLSHDLPPGVQVASFTVAPDASQVVYRVWGASEGDIYSVPLRRGTPIRLTALGSQASVSQFEVSPDSRRVVYLPYPERALFSVAIVGGSDPVRLDDGGDVQSQFQLTPRGERVLYEADRDAPGIDELFSVPTDGSQSPVKLNRPLDEGIVVADVSSFQFGALGDQGLFVVAIDVGNDEPLEELYSVGLEPVSRPVRLFTGAVGSTRLALDETRLMFTTLSEGGEGHPELFSAPIDGSSAPLLLNDPSGINFGVGRLVLAADGQTAYYSQDGSAAGIYRVSIDGSAPRVDLTGWSFFASQSFPFALSPDQSRVVVLADGLVRGHYELFSVPSDGSAPPVQLNDVAPPHGARSYPFEISADGTRVVYLTDQAIDGVAELFVVPIDGSAAPVKLSGTLPAGRQVSAFTLHADSERAVFQVNDASFARELFSVPIDGSAAPVRLNPALPAGGSVTDFRMAAGLTDVVYRADQEADERYELFAVPIDGSAAARKLNGALAAGGDVSGSFELAADGRVVYLADQAVDEVFELYSARLDAAAAPLQLTGPHVAGGDVQTFRLGSDGRQVVFVADHDADEVFELYAAPIDRIKGARKLNGPLTAGGDVRPQFSVGPDGKVVYLADQDQDTVIEVYLTSSSALRSASGTKR